MKFQSGTVDEAAVKLAGGQVLEGGSGVRVGGWVITSRHGPITEDAELEHIKHDLHTLAAPEQFYGHNYLRLTHEASGTTMSFTALDALQGWLSDKSDPVHVGESEEWMKSRQQDVQAHATTTLQYDWTYTTSYAGTVSRSAADGSSTNTAAAPAAAEGPAAAAAPAPGGDAAGTNGTSSSQLSQQQQQGLQWEDSGEQINRALLTSRDPILYYDELALYESELDDHGTSTVSLKVRVMPRCWYVLLRFWLRVDHVMVRLREARLFCQFDAPEPHVLREIRQHEGTFKELRAAGAPAEGPAYADADTAAAALMAVAPVGVKQYKLQRLNLQ